MQIAERKKLVSSIKDSIIDQENDSTLSTVNVASANGTEEDEVLTTDEVNAPGKNLLRRETSSSASSLEQSKDTSKEIFQTSSSLIYFITTYVYMYIYVCVN